MKKIASTLISLLVLFLVLVSFPQIEVKAQAKTIVVPDNFATIQDAINNASAGDTVFVKNGVYNEPIEIDKPLILLGEDSQNTIIELPYAKYMPRAVILVSGDNVTVSGFTIRNSLKSTGIILEIIGLNQPFHPHPFGCRIIGNNIINNVGGIHSYYGSNLIISENNITGNSSHGIYQSSSNSTISGNSIINNALSGIIIDSCSNVTIKENNITGNGLSGTSGVGGLYLRWDGPFYIYGNNITENMAGIQFGYGCNNSIIHENNIERNVIGVELRNFDLGDSGLGTGNVVHGNNFIENSQQALVNKEYVYNFTSHEDDPTFSNGTDIVSWDNGTTGNYWSDYEERYPNATKLDSSGVWNTPYLIDENNQDNYPLMEPTIIPEFPSWTIILPLVIAVLLVAVVYRKRLAK
jgi:parallel beta-helix repeat protein